MTRNRYNPTLAERNVQRNSAALESRESRAWQEQTRKISLQQELDWAIQDRLKKMERINKLEETLALLLCHVEPSDSDGERILNDLEHSLLYRYPDIRFRRTGNSITGSLDTSSPLSQQYWSGIQFISPRG